MVVAAFSQYFFGFSIFISSIFLIMLVLVQRGRGGGLTGALGGPGGQSAFGTKAGDLFTRITVGVAAVWIFLCASAVFFLKERALPETGVMGGRSAVIETTAPATDRAAVDETGSEPTPPVVNAEIADPSELESGNFNATPSVDNPAADAPAADRPASESAPAP